MEHTPTPFADNLVKTLHEHDRLKARNEALVKQLRILIEYAETLDISSRLPLGVAWKKSMIAEAKAALAEEE